MLNRAVPETSSAPRPLGASGNLLAEVESFLGRLDGIEKKHHLPVDDLLVFLALGRLGLAATTAGLSLRPVKCADLAKKLQTPKETVRRRLWRLADRGLAEVTARGALIANVDEWVRVARALTP